MVSCIIGVASNLNLKIIWIVNNNIVKKGLFKVSYLNLKVSDDRSSYVIFNMFLSYFISVLIQFKGILEKLFMSFRTFCNVFISSHVILVLKQNVFSIISLEF